MAITEIDAPVHAAPAGAAAGRKTPPSEAPRSSRRRPTRLKRRLAWAGGALALIVLVVWALLPSPVDVETALIDSGTLQVIVQNEGVTRVLDRYRIMAPVAGRLLRIQVREGDPVRAGDVIARIASSPLDPRSGTSARASVSAAEAMQEQATTIAEQTREAAQQARREVPRRRALAAAGAISQESLEQAELLAASRERELAAAESAARAAAAELAAARAALLDASPTGTASVVEVRSPAAGRVLRVIEASERAVAPGEPLVDIGDAESLEVIVDVLSTDAVRIRPGTPILVDDWGGGSPVRGTVKSIEPEAFTRISALGVEEQRVNVIGSLDEIPPSLGVGYRIEARFIVHESSDVVRVPLGGLFRIGDAWNAFVIQDGRAVRRVVKVGARGEEFAEALDGLRPGDEIILYPSDRIDEGVRVRRRQRAQAPASGN
jgi:HlyD family secretion protein